MAQPKGRRRNLQTVRELAQTKAQAKKRKSWWRRLFAPIGALCSWLNQPVHTHTESHSWLHGLTKQRSMVPAYVRHSFAELKLTTWPTWPLAFRLTSAVIVFAVFFAGLVTSLDWVLTQIFEEVILNRAENLRDLF